MRRNPWVALAVLCIAVLLAVIDNTIINIAIPSISRELGASTSGLQWVVDAYTLVFCGLLLVGGHLGDRFGRRFFLILGTTGFGITSGVVAMMDSLKELIVGRAVLGLFAAMLFPATLAILTNIFDGPTAAHKRRKSLAVAIWAGTAGASAALGPVLGGWLLNHFFWGSVFWINVPIAALTVIGAFILLPESKTHEKGRFDVLGVALSIAGIALLVWAFIEAPHNGWMSWTTICGIIGALALIGLFVWRELCAQFPVLDVRLFAIRNFSAPAVVITLAFFGLFGYLFLLTQYFQIVMAYGPLSAGLRTLPFAIMMGVFAPIGVMASHKIGQRLVMGGGAVIMVGGFVMFAFTTAHSSYWTHTVIAMTILAMGLAFISATATDLLMVSLPPHQAGVGAAINDQSRELGGTLGVAVLGSVSATLYANRVVSGLTPLGLPPSVINLAKSSVTAGAEVAHGLPAGMAARAMSVVSDGFVDAMSLATWVGVGVLSAGAMVAFFAVKHLDHHVDDPQDESAREKEGDRVRDGSFQDSHSTVATSVKS